MKDIFSIVVVNLIFLPVTVNMNLKYSNELMSPIYGQKSTYLSNKVRKALFLKSIAKSGQSKVRALGLFHYLLVAYPTLLFSVVIVILSLIQMINCICGLEFKWFTTAFLVLSSFGLMSYSALMVVVFGFLSWIFKKKRGL